MSLGNIDAVLNPLMVAVFANFKSDFDQSEMRLVQTSCGFSEMTKIEYLEKDGICWKAGAIGAIGENAKKRDGTAFTAFLISTGGDKMEVKTLSQIRHSVETGLPALWVDALRKGWKIVPCSCGCGGNYAWLKPSTYGGADVMFGCICHNRPTP